MQDCTGCKVMNMYGEDEDDFQFSIVETVCSLCEPTVTPMIKEVLRTEEGTLVVSNGN